MTWKDEILKRITPTPREVNVIEQRLNKVIDYLRELGFKVKVGGSFAKRTFLKNRREVDVFILLPKHVPYHSFREIVERLRTAVPFPSQLRFAHHPYVRFEVDGVSVDVVPAYDVEIGEVMSPVDRSVFHTDFVLKHLSEEQRAEVLLLKAFLKANAFYGAEIRVKGFSGYLAELLIIKFGSFERVLSHFAYKGDFTLSLSSVNKEFHEPLVFVDPVDPERNVASAVSEEQLWRFVLFSKMWFATEHKHAFFQPWVRAEVAERLLTRLPMLCWSFEFSDVDDVSWGKVWRFVRQFNACLKKCGGRVLGTATDNDTLLVSYLLPPYYLQRGPPFSAHQHVMRFVSDGKPVFFNNVSVRRCGCDEHSFSLSHAPYPFTLFLPSVNDKVFHTFLIKYFPSITLNGQRTWNR
jgi:tRNA nucleotidyltransferase (CCA-adding enzyme)